jgi:hypothetical protein
MVMLVIVAPGAVGLCFESLSALSLQEDRLVALVKAGQVRVSTDRCNLVRRSLDAGAGPHPERLA